eukprot:COSAG06_NODE_62332_length_265_cov_0.656627_1_plen_22_part_10
MGARLAVETAGFERKTARNLKL